MREVDKVIGENEKIFWEGKPVFWPYLLSDNARQVTVGFIILLFMIPFIVGGFTFKNFYQLTQFSTVNEQMPSQINGFASMFSSMWIVGLIPFIFIALNLIVGNTIYRIFLYKHLHYVITDKRIIIQKGVVGRDFKYIDFDKVTNSEVIVSFWDKLLNKNTGSILISSPTSFIASKEGQQIPIPDSISNIENPYEVSKFFNKVSYDVKTDIEYPNQFRPTENPGYKTNYDPNKKEQ